MRRNRQILLQGRPSGLPTLDHFRLVESPMPQPKEGELLVRNVLLSLDPYMRGMMDEGKSYIPPVPVGGVMRGETVGEVVETRDPRFAAGEIVVGPGHWQEYASFRAARARQLDPAAAPVSTALGVLGMPGKTAYVGLFKIAKPKPGETVVVSAASGAVGAAAGQMAKIHGCRVVGIAGGAAKCRYVTGELGFDACVDHRAPGFAEELARACPDGIDVDFENVGGGVLAAVWPLLNDFARVALCGLIAEYNDTAPRAGPSLGPVLEKRIEVRGFIVIDHEEVTPDFLRETTQWVREGRIRCREHFVDGLERAPEAFLGLFEGRNFGKLIVRVAS
ncbi:MAG: NADP-dependent oxidoreductase [Planctomycetota bacterium]|nr:MAG: NADP-dependent oxidoreductase [Planctomycetota bacterium]